MRTSSACLPAARWPKLAERAPAAGTAAGEPHGTAALDAAFAALGIVPRTVEHEAVFTVEQSQALRGTIPGQHTKNLFLKDKKGALFLVTAAEDAALDLKRLHTVIGARGRLSFGSADLLMDTLGIEPGSVSPLALVNDRAGRVAFVLDRTVAEAPLVNVHPLRNTATVTLEGDQFARFLDHVAHPPMVVDLPAPAD